MIGTIDPIRNDYKQAQHLFKGEFEMAQVRINNRCYDISMMVFDKDGLMFKSQPFWIELGNERIRHLKEYLDDAAIEEWASVFGLTLTDGGVTYADPKGILAVAAPNEEISITAGILVKHLSIHWAKALEMARDIFRAADTELDLSKAIVPREGFPDILDKLRSAGIPYAVATSDTKQRVVDSLAMVHEKAPDMVVVPEMVEKGKPAPDMLYLVAERAKVPIEKIAMVGDSYVDVKMAQSAGAIGIGVPETEEMRASIAQYASVIADSLQCIEVE